MTVVVFLILLLGAVPIALVLALTAMWYIQASGNANVALKSFDTLQDSVRDYMRNLNRNRAYRGFRAARAGMRSSQRPLDEIELVGTLALYSEEGGVYVERLRTVMDLPEVQAVKHAGFVDPR